MQHCAYYRKNDPKHILDYNTLSGCCCIKQTTITDSITQTTKIMNYCKNPLGLCIYNVNCRENDSEFFLFYSLHKIGITKTKYE